MKPLFILSLSLVLIGCSKPQLDLSDVLAKVGNRRIGPAEWQAEIARRLASGQSLPAKEQLLDELILRESLISRALELRLDETPEIRRRYENLLIAELKERELKPKLEEATVRPDEVRTALNQARQHPPQVRIAVLQLKANARVSENKRRQLAERLVEAREKALRIPADEVGFGALAVDYSDDQSTRYTGGDKGWFNVGSTNQALAPELITAANSLPNVGDVSDVIRTDRGLHLVRLIGRRSAGEALPAKPESAVQHRLLTKERKRIESEFAVAARSRLSVEVNAPAFAALPYQTPTSLAQTVSLPPALP